MSSYALFYGYGEKKNQVPAYWIDKYEKDADKFWNKFYNNNKSNFFKDRHWFLREFPELNPENTPKNPDGTKMQQFLLEVGCGVGNTVYPLLEENPHLFIYAFDFAPTAVKLAQEHSNYDPKRCKFFVCNAVKDEPSTEIPEQSLDFIMMIFVLSAISPEAMPTVLTKLFKLLKPGGKLLFRDYAVNDMAQLRFEKERRDRETNKISENFYVRGDGTRAYYFTPELLREMMIQIGFIEESNEIVEREQENVKEEKHMFRKFVQARFLRPAGTIDSVIEQFSKLSSNDSPMDTDIS